MALKDNPLTPTEITSAGGTVGYTYSDANSTGGIAYHASSTAYGTSDVKSVVDTWANNKFTDELKEVDGYSARLIQFSELMPGLGYVKNGENYPVNGNVPSWVWNSNYWYWTMTPWQDGDQPSSLDVWNVCGDGTFDYNDEGAVRPVINVYKSKISS